MAPFLQRQTQLPMEQLALAEEAVVDMEEQVGTVLVSSHLVIRMAVLEEAEVEVDMGHLEETAVNGVVVEAEDMEGLVARFLLMQAATAVEAEDMGQTIMAQEAETSDLVHGYLLKMEYVSSLTLQKK